jgi:hypothetical protein
MREIRTAKLDLVPQLSNYSEDDELKSPRSLDDTLQWAVSEHT